LVDSPSKAESNQNNTSTGNRDVPISDTDSSSDNLSESRTRGISGSTDMERREGHEENSSDVSAMSSSEEGSISLPLTEESFQTISEDEVKTCTSTNSLLETSSISHAITSMEEGEDTPSDSCPITQIKAISEFSKTLIEVVVYRPLSKTLKILKASREDPMLLYQSENEDDSSDQDAVHGHMHIDYADSSS
ncbi:hypothetical protein RUND412_005651, partial [Rhizina undulata]